MQLLGKDCAEAMCFRVPTVSQYHHRERVYQHCQYNI